MLNSKDPELLQYSRYLDKVGTHRKAPRWTISWNENDAQALRKTGASHLEPGQYKLDRDFVSDKTQEVRKGALTDSIRARQFKFTSEDRTDKHMKALRGIVRPYNDYINPTGPGSYQTIDGMEHHQRVSRPSSFAYTTAKGEPAEFVRERKLQGRAPAPGTYTVSSFFDNVDREHQEQLAKHGRRPKKSEWENQWGNYFRAVHASAQTKKPSSTH
mmetsp:Transcript_90093/g.160444  ORF Transcript_90093/g.160444 Transcript_90093/m.160444 type:complete len:215 (-) Transcript_90093:8-652(-)